VRSRKLLFELVQKPLLGVVMLTLRAVPIAAGMVDAVLFATALALIETVPILSAWAVLDGADGPWV
jgi:hypothetical protein